MGVGKSTIGEALANEIGRPFLDSDVMLEERAGEPGSDIAARDGVDRLHEHELEVFLDMCRAETPSVLAPAASVVDHEVGRVAFGENVTVWLTAPDEVLVERQRQGVHRRPVDEDERTSLRLRRAPHLERLSTITIDTGAGSPDEVVRDLITRLRGARLL